MSAAEERPHQALLTMVTGMCLGWAIGAAGMKAALSARNQLVLKQSLQQEAQRCAYTQVMCCALTLKSIQYRGFSKS